MMQALTEGFPKPVEIEVIDIEEDPDRAATYGVRGVPTLVKIVDGETVAVRNGANLNVALFKKWVTAE